MLAIYIFLHFASANVIDLDTYKNAYLSQADKSPEVQIEQTFEKIKKQNQRGELSTKQLESYLYQFLDMRAQLQNQTVAAKAYHHNWSDFLTQSFYLENLSAKSLWLLIESISVMQSSSVEKTRFYATNLLRDLTSRFASNARREHINSRVLIDALLTHKIRFGFIEMKTLISSIQAHELLEVHNKLESLRSLYEVNPNEFKNDGRFFQKRFDYLTQALAVRVLSRGVTNENNQKEYVREVFSFNRQYMPNRMGTKDNLIEKINLEDFNRIRQNFIHNYQVDLFLLETYLNHYRGNLSGAEVFKLFRTHINEDLSLRGNVYSLNNNIEEKRLENRMERYRQGLLALLNNNYRSISQETTSEIRGFLNNVDFLAQGRGACRLLFQ